MAHHPVFPDAQWVSLLGADPRAWLWEAGDPVVQYFMLRHALAATDDEDAQAELHADLHKAALADPQVRALIDALPDWETEPVTGHNKPSFAPNLLILLADMGVQPGDEPAVERLLDQMLAHQEASGHFASFGIAFRETEPVWGSVLCDTHAIVECLVRYGRGAAPEVQAALACMKAELIETTQGWGWPCVPHSVSGWRGPGRKGDFCPQVTLEALRVYAQLPQAQWPAHLLDAAATSLRAWQARAEENPYMFGHGRQFKTVKWPSVWYDVSSLFAALRSYASLRAEAATRSVLAELLACLAAYNFSPQGTVTPHSCYRGYEAFSFGQKKQPSPWATAYLCSILVAYGDIAGQARRVDVLALSSSKGGKGQALPPK